MLKNLISCFHRKGIDSDHENCFAQGEVIDRRIDKTIPWYQQDGMKIGYLDIETDGLKTDFSTMLSWCVKEKGGKVDLDCVTKAELFNGTTDQRIIKSLLDKLNEYKIIVTYFGTKFDVPFVRTKALHYNMDFPSYAQLFHFDIFYTVKSKLNLSSKSLDSACDYLNIEGKTPLKKDIWRRAKYGDAEALANIVEHNIADVVILERLHDKLTPFAKWTRKSA